MEMPIVRIMVFLTVSWIAEAICLKGARWRTPSLTLIACGLLVACLIAQLSFPWLLILFERDNTHIRRSMVAYGECSLFPGWRAGWGSYERCYFVLDRECCRAGSEPMVWLLISIGGALIAECFALCWQPVGAGNSVATCSLPGSLIMNRPFSRVPTISKVLRAAES